MPQSRLTQNDSTTTESESQPQSKKPQSTQMMPPRPDLSDIQ